MEYDEQQQAWRYLGFVIDCDSATDDDASWDGGTGEGCTRFVLWAAVSCKVAQACVVDLTSTYWLFDLGYLNFYSD